MSREAQPAYVKGQRLWLVDDATGAFDTEVLVEQVVAREPSRKTGADFFAALVAPLTGHTGGGEKESLPGSVAVAPAGGGPAVWIRPEQLAARLSPVPQLAWPSPQQASGAWDAGSACVLCSEGAEAQFAGRGLFIPKDVACSVRAAASALNEGTLECSEGFCAVFSSDRGQWYVLHRAGLRDAALTSFGLPDGRVPPPSGPPGMTPRLACSGSVLGLPGDGPTFEPGDRIEMKRYDGEDWEAGGEVRDVVTDGPRQLGDLEMPVGSVLVAFQNGAALKWVWAQEVPTRLRKEESDRSHRDESDSDSGAVFDLDAWAAADASGSEAVAEVLGFSAGDGAEVWSNSKGVWLPCLVLAVFPHEVEADGFTVPPNTVKVQSEAGVKYIREDAVPQELRRTQAQQRCPPGPTLLGTSLQAKAPSPPTAEPPPPPTTVPESEPAPAPPATAAPAPLPPAAAAPAPALLIPSAPAPAPPAAAAPAPLPPAAAAPASAAAPAPPCPLSAEALVGDGVAEQAPPAERRFVKYHGRRPLRAGERVHVFDAVKGDWETDCEVVSVLDAPLTLATFEVPAGSVTVTIRNESGVGRRTIQPEFLSTMVKCVEDDPAETLEDERVAAAWEAVFARFQAGGQVELVREGTFHGPPLQSGGLDRSDPKGQSGVPNTTDAGGVSSLPSTRKDGDAEHRADNHDPTPRAAMPPSRVPQKGVMLPDLHNVSILGDDFTPTALGGSLPEPPAYDRRKQKVLIIGVGFGLKVNERQFNMIRDAGFQTKVLHDVPNPELPNFDMAPHIYKLRDTIREYKPDLLAVGSKGGAYLAVLWKLRYWTGPTVVLNRHPTLTELPKDANVVLAHGSNDEVYPQPRKRLEAVIRTGDPNRCLLYYTNNSGLLAGRTLTRQGDFHNMESLLLYDCLPRLCDAALCREGPEMQLMQSWMQMTSDERSEAERWLGFSMSDLRRLWDRDSQGAGEGVAFEVPPGCEEWDAVSAIFKAQPKVARAYHDMNPGMWQNVEIARIDRIENAPQDDGCEVYARTMQRGLEQQGLTFRPGLHTRWAFHGSSAVEEIVRDPVAGFQPLLGGSRASTVWGPGTYFARDAKYVYDGGFCRVLPDGSRQILLCLLMTGMPCLGDPEHKGLLPIRSGRHRYNSSVDYLSNPEIFITQYPQAAYPAYVITFQS